MLNIFHFVPLTISNSILYIYRLISNGYCYTSFIVVAKTTDNNLQPSVFQKNIIFISSYSINYSPSFNNKRIYNKKRARTHISNFLKVRLW